MSVFVKQKGTTLDTFQIGKSGVTLDASGVSNKTLTVPDKNGTIATLDDIGGGAAWGSITGTLSSQTDLNTALSGLKKFTMQMVLEAGANNTYEFQRSARFAFTINAAYYDTVAGSITANVKINSTSVTGLSALSISTSPSNATATAANSVSVGDIVSVTFTSNSSATFVSLMLECTRV